MELNEFKAKKYENIISSMVDYMNYDDEDEEEDFDCGYTQADIDECCRILDNYIDELIALSSNPSAGKIMESVRNVVLALNKLTENSPLIETDQREYLVPFIIEAAKTAGLEVKTLPDDDITYEWREW
ncbi:MAG: hypothetical protein FWG10_11760 [Eubacteriaceae bacterium]|nr:hypothetical protein [Eubacteriaceae bacterium]